MAKPKAHFLHIGKTGGSAVKAALLDHRSKGKFEIVLHPHPFRLPDVPSGEAVFFVLRHPVTRFVSGFNSRKRQGRPRYQAPWDDKERQAFARFENPNDLAEALSSDDETERQQAYQAMGDIGHVRHSVWHWFQDPRYMHSRSQDILFVAFQETLTADFARLRRVLGLGEDITLPTNPAKTHRTPNHLDQELSELGRQNIEAHYARDLKLYEGIRAMRGAR